MVRPGIFMSLYLMLVLTFISSSVCVQLIYESFAGYLVEHKGYDKDLLNLTPADWDFW